MKRFKAALGAIALPTIALVLLFGLGGLAGIFSAGCDMVRETVKEIRQNGTN